MRDPVVAADGHSYERAAISEYFKIDNRPKSPITGLPLKNTDLFDNYALKAMIGEWKPGRQSEPSALETREADSIAQRVKEAFTKNAALLNSAKDEHIVAFLGNTGAGKSTLVNLLAGKELKVSSDGEDYVLAHPDDKAAMVIGTSGNSETLYPKYIDVDGLRFFDLPGFNDTDGSERNLINAAFTRQILIDAASVRLVFVAGQDQFTADRSASIRQMFYGIKQLFVVGQDISLVDEGVFVATKITCNDQTEIIDFLLKKTDSKDKADLNEQLISWSQRNKLCRMFHPIREENNKGIRDHILRLIKDTRPSKILGINVSVLYPPDTKGPLERMFSRVIEDVLNRKLHTPLETLSDYDRAITFYTSVDFWKTFDADVCREEDAIGLLKEFCINPYNKAFRNFEKEKEGIRKTHIKRLRNERKERVDDIEYRTGEKATEVISSLVPRKEGDDFVFFDFAYHKDFYDQVCGTDSIDQLATDAPEQEVVRRYYAGFISQHSHEQMMRWHQKFSGIKLVQQDIEDLKKKLKATQSKVNYLRRNAQVAEVEQRGIKQIERPTIPPVARGHEDIYERFLKGVLIYKPQAKGEDELRVMRISDLVDPLEGTFDLSQCGDAGKYLSISTGYRKEKKEENAKKVEIWIAPRFLIEKEINGSASHFQRIFGEWLESAPVGIFWTWGEWDRMDWCDHLTNEKMDNLSEINLHKNWEPTTNDMRDPRIRTTKGFYHGLHGGVACSARDHSFRFHFPK
jgi:energy-coupling factor transporter ATP-binding protein EcfA2